MTLATVRNPADTISTFLVTIVEKATNIMHDTRTHNYSVQDVIQDCVDALPDSYFIYKITNLETGAQFNRKQIQEVL